MATTFTKSVQPQDGSWIVSFGIGSKDPADVTLAQQYGDLDLDFSGKYVDPNDNTFAFTIVKDKENTKWPDGREIFTHCSSSVWSNILLNKLPNAAFTYVFDDAAIPSVTRYRMATIFANAVQTIITNALTALRAMPSTAAVNSTFTV